MLKKINMLTDLQIRKGSSEKTGSVHAQKNGMCVGTGSKLIENFLSIQI
jgi:hypothetical protein